MTNAIQKRVVLLEHLRSRLNFYADEESSKHINPLIHSTICKTADYPVTILMNNKIKDPISVSITISNHENNGEPILRVHGLIGKEDHELSLSIDEIYPLLSDEQKVQVTNMVKKLSDWKRDES